MGEGPSSTKPLQKDWSTLLLDLDQAQNKISGAVFSDLVSYTTVSFPAWNTLTQPVKTLENAVQDGENQLQSALVSYTAGCKPQRDKVVLVGYSMGAWVINQWLSDSKYRGEWSMIKGVLLYGDPCYINGSDAGLARAFNAPGCMPANTYPAPVAGATFPIPDEVWCAALDGVCGGGYSAKGDPTNRTTELLAATGCAIGNCHHFDYWYAGASSSDLAAGAKLMVKWVGA